MSLRNFKVGPEYHRVRLDVFLSGLLPDWSRSRIQAALKKQGLKASDLVQEGQVVRFEEPPVQPSALKAQKMELSIVYEDEELLVINKPAGLVVHPGAGHQENTLVNALLYRYPDLKIGDTQRPGIVHRLDKNTSGLMLVAKNSQTHEALSHAFKEREVEKIYLALCVGSFEKNQFSLDTPHRRHPKNRKKFTTKYPSEKRAHSSFHVLRSNAQITELKIQIFTGRTHQIRVQLADIGHPILGDTLYGAPTIPGFDRHALHAQKLSFFHPTTLEWLSFENNPDWVNFL